MRPEHSGLTCAHVHDEFRTCASPSIYDPKLDPAFSADTGKDSFWNA